MAWNQVSLISSYIYVWVELGVNLSFVIIVP